MTSRADFGATFRNTAGQILGRTSARTVCWRAKAPSKYAARSEDGQRETVIRCGECAGCLELDALRLRRRLKAMYQEVKGQLWAVIVWAEFSEQSKVRRRLSRMKQCSSLSGLFRLQKTSFAAIATKEPKNLAALSSRIGCSITTVKLGACDKRRRFRLLTQGLKVSRSEWGEQTNRYYQRGLPPAEKDHWITNQRGGIRSRHPEFQLGVRAINGDTGLYPPEAWRPPRLVRRRDSERRNNTNPRRAAETLPTVLAHLIGVAKAPALPVNRGRGEAAAPASAMTGFRDAPALADPPNRKEGANRANGNNSAPAPSSEIRSRDLSLGSGYRSSVHSSKEWLDEWAAKMAAKARERPPPK